MVSSEFRERVIIRGIHGGFVSGRINEQRQLYIYVHVVMTIVGPHALSYSGDYIYGSSGNVRARAFEFALPLRVVYTQVLTRSSRWSHAQQSPHKKLLKLL